MRTLAAALCILLTAASLYAHDVNGNPVTWNREISRIMNQRCVSCHHSGADTFSLMTYKDAQPWANEIKEAVLSRTMPPWGAVKGFGEFRNDTALTPVEIALISDWVDGGVRRGNNPNTLPEEPELVATPPFTPPSDAPKVSGDSVLRGAVILDGVYPQKTPPGASFQITAELPDGTVEPLVWLFQYDNRYAHPFLFKEPLELPAGTRIRGVPANAVLLLLTR